jgi:hypothetical protein
MNSRRHSKRTTQIVAGLLAVAWICAGMAAVVLAIAARRWLFALAGLGALWYGLLWVRVAREGRQLTGREALMPWRPPKSGD